MAAINKKAFISEKTPSDFHVSDSTEIEDGALREINASGHTQETLRHFNLLSLLAAGVVFSNAWTALAGTLVVAIRNGGPPGVIYEFLVVCLMYCFIAASIAELGSAMPSSGGVYHYASVCGGKNYGRICGWFAGWWNFSASVFALASFSSILGNLIITMYGLFHLDFEPKSWHVFVCYVIITWIACCATLFLNRILPLIEKFSLAIILVGCLVTIIVCAFMPKVRGVPYATNHSVWKDWANETGYSSNGFVFVMGMLNGAYGIGSPDVATHLAEEIPRPSRNIPLVIFYQTVIGFLSGFSFLVAILHAINDLDAIITSSASFPLTEIYHQATGSAGGALALLLFIFFAAFVALIAGYVTAGRTFWTLARDGVTPFSAIFAKIDPQKKNPFNATLFCGCACTVLACVYVGSVAAFNAFIGSAVIAITLSYLAAILPHLLSRRKSVEPGWFWMSGWLGCVVNALSCAYIMAFIVIFSFPFSMPVDASNMNYTSLLIGGLSLFIAAWWLIKRGQYKGPRFVSRGNEALAKDAI